MASGQSIGRHDIGLYAAETKPSDSGLEETHRCRHEFQRSPPRREATGA